MSETWTWATLALLGAYHGLNPAMGWLFAVALGLQEQRRTAVLRAIGPIAIGHALSIAAVVALFIGARSLVSADTLRVVGGGALLLFGVYKLVARSHPRWVGMRVNGRQLTAWSFLMSSAHGAGLMLVPVLLGRPDTAAAQAHHAHMHHSHAEHVMMAGGTGSLAAADLAAIGLHTAAMFLVMGAVAVLVYERLGLAILRRAWVNLDLVWAGTLVAAGVVTLAMR